MDIYTGKELLLTGDANIYKLFIEGIIESIDKRYFEVGYEERFLLEAQRHRLLETKEEMI